MFAMVKFLIEPCRKPEKPVSVLGRFPSLILSANIHIVKPKLLFSRNWNTMTMIILIIMTVIHPNLNHHLNKLLKVHRARPIPVSILKSFEEVDKGRIQKIKMEI